MSLEDFRRCCELMEQSSVNDVLFGREYKPLGIQAPLRIAAITPRVQAILRNAVQAIR